MGDFSRLGNGCAKLTDNSDGEMSKCSSSSSFHPWWLFGRRHTKPLYIPHFYRSTPLLKKGFWKSTTCMPPGYTSSNIQESFRHRQNIQIALSGVAASPPALSRHDASLTRSLLPMAPGATKGLAQAHERVNTRSQSRFHIDEPSEDLIVLDSESLTNPNVCGSNDATAAFAFGEVQEKRYRQPSQKARENGAAMEAQDVEAPIRKTRSSVSSGPVSSKEFNMLYNLVSKVFAELVNARREIDTVRSELKTAQSTTEHVRDKVNTLESTTS